MANQDTIAERLKVAAQSAKRLEEHPVHKSTLQLWAELVAEARSRRAAGELLGADLDDSIAALESALARKLG